MSLRGIRLCGGVTPLHILTLEFMTSLYTHEQLKNKLA